MSKVKTTKKTHIKIKNPAKFLSFILIGLIFALIFTTYEFIFTDKFFPNTYIADTNVTLLTKPQAYQLVVAKFNQRSNQKLEFNLEDKKFYIDIATSSAKITESDFINQAFLIGHSGTILDQLKDQFKLIIFSKIVVPHFEFNIDKQVDLIEKSVNQAPINSTVFLNDKGQVEVTESKEGIQLDSLQLKGKVTNFLAFGNYQSNLPLKVVKPNASYEKGQKVKSILEGVNQEPIVLSFNNQSWTIDQKTLISLTDLNQPNNQFIDPDKLSGFIKSVAEKIDQPVVEALFNFDPTIKRVTAFKAGQVGQTLNQQKTNQLIILALEDQRPKNITLPVETVTPTTQTADVNDLGINELLGRGVSNFAGSISNRIYNVNLTAQKINGVLIAPGQVFSFNQTVGDITEATGFKKAYVIKEGRTVLDDGGGVCQDSTTLFRAVLNAGLPILKRTAHAYRVSYYEQGFPVGLDATVFYPSVDFQFKNDTQKHILIQAYTQGLTLYIDLYGSSDGRTTSLTKPVISNQTPPPPELRQDDPTLPKGTVKQVDWSAWGANVSFNRTVIRNGETIISETWRSNYKPWQAVFLVGTQ